MPLGSTSWRIGILVYVLVVVIKDLLHYQNGSITGFFLLYRLDFHRSPEPDFPNKVCNPAARLRLIVCSYMTQKPHENIRFNVIMAAELLFPKLVVFGASGPTGRHLVQQALKNGHVVSAVVRNPNKFDIKQVIQS